MKPYYIRTTQETLHLYWADDLPHACVQHLDAFPSNDPLHEIASIITPNEITNIIQDHKNGFLEPPT